MVEGRQELNTKITEFKKSTSQFSNIQYKLPEIAHFLSEFGKYMEEDQKKIEGLEKKISGMENKSSNELLDEVMGQIKKAYGKIGMHAFMEYIKTPSGQKSLQAVLSVNQESIVSAIKAEMGKKGGLFSPFISMGRKYLLTTAGIEAVFMMALVGASVFYVATRTPVGKYIGYQNKIERIESIVYTPKTDDRGKIVKNLKGDIVYENKIEKMEKKYNDLEKSLKEEGHKKEVEEAINKNYNEQMKPKIDVYEKEISQLKSEIEEKDKKYGKINEDYDKKIKELEKKVEKSNKGFIKSINPLK